MAERALQSQNLAEGVDYLTKAAQQCFDDAARLKIAYAKLQERCDCVNEDLNRTTSFMNSVLHKISEAILFVSLDGIISIANESANRWLKKKLVGKKFWDVFSDDMFGFSMREALRYGISHQLLYKTLADLGRELEISTWFLYEGPKSQHGLIVLMRDISERQKLQQMAGRTDRMKELGEMAANVAHEIRNPLGGIRGFATLLYRDLAGQKQLQELAAQVIEGTKSLEKLVTNVLQYARPVQITVQTLDLSQYLKQIARFVKIDPAYPPNVKMELNIPDEPLILPIDPDALKAALLNLLFNALQAMNTGGTLTFSLMKSEAHCQISVADTGTGIREDQLRLLFLPFFTTKHAGTGLGLVEAQKIVQAHGGNIDVRSAVGRGSTFTITLPLKR